MPLQKLQFRPGLNREGTDYSNEGGWYDGDKIRFRSGFPEKIGGWTRMSDEQYLGVARSLWNWVDLGGSNYLGVGTNVKYYIERGGTYYDVTPITHTSDTLGAPGGPFTAINGSSIITVVDAAYPPGVGDYVTFSGCTTLGGAITAEVLDAEFEVLSTPSSTSYTIDVGVNANASDTNNGGATVKAEYQVPIGLNSYSIGTGWGAGPWPFFETTVLTDPFTASGAGVQILTVTQTAHGLITGDYVFFTSVASDPCGITKVLLEQSYPVTNTGANTYTINLAPVTTETTSSGAASGGAVTILTPLPPDRGWGEGYSNGGIGQQLRLWSNDNYGQDLIIAPRGGAIYYWESALGPQTRAKALSTLADDKGFDGDYVPIATYQVLSSAIQRFVIAMGSNSYLVGDPDTPFDPMLVRWSDQENPYEWVPAITNQAGEFRLSNGSYIMQSKATRQEILIWTDSCLYSMQYLGAPYVWGFNILMDNISVMSPNSMITVNNVTYWMGTDKFYMYSGRVETLPCSLWQYIFDDINKEQAFQVFCGSNEGYSEIWWFYCSQNSDTVDKYVIYNYLDRVWYYGSMARTAWLDSGLRQYPMAANYENRILFHESAVDDVSGLTPVPIVSYVQSSDFDIGDGHNFGFVWRILPDINFNASNVNAPQVTMTVKPRQNSGSPYSAADNPVVASSDNFTNRGVYTIQEFTGQVYTRLRGRQMSFRIESTTLGVAWQLGSPRIDIRNDGRR